jgi:hypothetical protein
LLARYFTNAEDAMNVFQTLVAADRLDRRLLVVHADAALGKSSLLRMYRLHCRQTGIPVALAAAADGPSADGILARWGELDVELPRFRKDLDRYHELQAKANAAAAGFVAPDVAGPATKLAAEGMAVGLSFLPGVGQIAAAVGPDRLEAILTLIQKALSREEYEFWSNPTERLTDQFLVEVDRAAVKRRIVLMFDTFEQAGGQSSWLRDVAQRLPENVLFVIAGRDVPAWDRDWPGWVAHRALVELREMSTEQTATLVRRYYALAGEGEPDEAFVQEVVEFARGLPLAAATAVELAVSYRFEDFRAGDGDVATQLADKMLEGVPDELRPTLEAAALLRSFNADSLGALLGLDDAAPLYEKLRRLPFARGLRNGFAVHDVMREVIGNALKARSPERFRELSERAASYYERLLAAPSGEDPERLQLERLYHLVRVDEARGLAEFRALAEDLCRAQWIGRLRALVTDAGAYAFTSTNARLWRRYYAARLEHLAGHTAFAEREYRDLGGNVEAEPTLRAYGLCDLGTILATLDRLAEPNGERAALDAVAESMRLQPVLDSKLVTNHFTLMNISNRNTQWEQSVEHVRAARDFARANNAAYALVDAERLESALQALQGDWGGYLASREKALAALAGIGDVPALRMKVEYLTWPLVFMGRYAEAQRSCEHALELALRIDERELLITIRESVALTLGVQDEFAEAEAEFARAEEFYEQLHAHEEAGSPERFIRAMLSFRGLVRMRDGRLDEAEADLERALAIKREIDDRLGLPELYVWRGQLQELRRAWDAADGEYSEALQLENLNRRYLHCHALVGRARVRLAQRRLEDATALAAEAGTIARTLGYDDVLACVRLTEGHLAAAEGEDGVEQYRDALAAALRYNRFLLDEVLCGRPQGTPLQPIVLACLERGAAGKQALAGLRERWRGNESVEREARSREPGAGGAQQSVLEQLDAAA